MSFSATGVEALAIARENPARQWTGGPVGSSAQERLSANSYFPIRHRSKFEFDRETKIFTMGSCFAREVENVLTRAGVPLVTADFGVRPELFDSWDEAKGTGGGVMAGQLSRGAFNKYTVASMTHEIRRVVLKQVFQDDGLIDLGSDSWFDPHASGTKTGPFAEVLECRAQVAAATAQIHTADVVFLTLGLVEGWIDTQTGLAMNRVPAGRSLMRLANRFKLSVPSYGETVADLDACMSLIREVCNPNMRFVVTVSPVPFQSTFRPMDVVTANTLSKSLLRAVVDELSSKHDYVDYFPSYEMVVNSPRALAWEDDMMHVNHRMVAHVMENFKGSYLKH